MSAIILANGEVPKNSKVINLLHSADYLICTDGSYDYALNLNIVPDAVIGDFDSIDKSKIKKNIKTIDAFNQDKSDLEKAINYCIESNFKKIKIIGSTGLRDDHTFANLFLLEEYSKDINIQIYTDYYKIFISNGINHFKSFPGSIISMVSFYKDNLITTEGLKYELKNEILKSASHGVSNISIKKNFMISSTHPIYVFQEF